MAWTIWHRDQEIQEALDALLDLKTGELAPEFEELLRTHLIEVASRYRECETHRLAIKAGRDELVKPLNQRMASLEREAQRCLEFLNRHIGEGETLRDERVQVKWQYMPDVCVVADESKVPEWLRREVDRPADIARAKQMLKDGQEAPGFELRRQKRKLVVK